MSGGLKWILFLDAAIAFSLTVSLYVACIGALYVMRAIGWEGVEPTALINAFQGNVNWNFDSPALWLGDVGVYEFTSNIGTFRDGAFGRVS